MGSKGGAKSLQTVSLVLPFLTKTILSLRRSMVFVKSTLHMYSMLFLTLLTSYKQHGFKIIHLWDLY